MRGALVLAVLSVVGTACTATPRQIPAARSQSPASLPTPSPSDSPARPRPVLPSRGLALQANGHSYLPSISSDGRFVVFVSDARGLVAGRDAPCIRENCNQVFLRDRATNTTTRISVDGKGNRVIGFKGVLSADGSVAIFLSPSKGRTGLFVRDLRRGTTDQILTGWTEIRDFVVSGDGRFIAFGSGEADPEPGPAGGQAAIFRYDRMTGKTVLVSVADDEQESNWHSEHPSISGDGRFVAFASDASNLVPGDTNEARDVFVRDVEVGTTERVSVTRHRSQEEMPSDSPAISNDGRVIGFVSVGSQGLENDFQPPGVFVHDRTNGKTEAIFVMDDGTTHGPAGCLRDTDGCSLNLSADGRYVVFPAWWSLDVTHPDARGVFVRDRIARTTRLVSLTWRGRVSHKSEHEVEWTMEPSIAAAGRFVAFTSFRSDLVPGDTNGKLDVFVRDLSAGTTERVSVGSR